MEKLIGILLVALSPASAFALTPEIQRLESVIENEIGTKVLWSWGNILCSRPVYGFYVPSKDLIVMCQENHKKDYGELLGTIKHEAWHAVQVKCNNGRAALSQDQIRPHLKARDKNSLHGYHPTDTYAEAEARVVEQIPTDAWIRGARSYCRL